MRYIKLDVRSFVENALERDTSIDKSMITNINGNSDWKSVNSEYAGDCTPATVVVSETLMRTPPLC